MDEKMLEVAKKVHEIENVSLKVYGIMKEFNFYDVEEATVQDLTKELLNDPYSVINSLTEIVDRLSNDLNTEKEKVDFCIDEATKKLNADNRIVCDHKTLYTCVVNKKELSFYELAEIGNYFKSCVYGEVIKEYYKKGISDEEAFILGNKVNNYLNCEDEISEKQAIEKVLDIERIERIKQIHNTLADMYGELFDIATETEINDELKFVQDAIKNTTKGE